MTKINPMTSVMAYKVFMRISRNSKGDYPSQMARDLDSTQSSVSDRLKALREINLAKRGERTQAQYYNVDPEGLVNLFRDIWDLDEDQVPESFQAFLMDWVKVYDKGDSSIRRMLREDFAEAVHEYRRDNDDQLPEELEFLEDVDRMKGYVNVKAYLDRILD